MRSLSIGTIVRNQNSVSDVGENDNDMTTCTTWDQCCSLCGKKENFAVECWSVPQVQTTRSKQVMAKQANHFTDDACIECFVSSSVSDQSVNDPFGREWADSGLLVLGRKQKGLNVTSRKCSHHPSYLRVMCENRRSLLQRVHQV